MARLDKSIIIFYSRCAALALLLSFTSAAYATKLDLSSNVEIRAGNYAHLVYGELRNSQPLFSENATLGFVIKGLQLEKTRESAMDVGIVLQSIGPGASTNTVISPQFADAAARLPNSNGTPFIRSAYVKIYKFMRPNITATFGRQDFMLGQGITLSGGDLGLAGGRLEADNLLGRVKADLFVFRPFKTNRFYKLYGGAAYYPSTEGLWQVYHFWEKDDGAAQDILFKALSKTKKFTGVRYFLSQKQLTFDGEAVVQRGTAKLSGGGTGKYEAHAFIIKGSWNQDIAFFGQSKVRVAYGRSSGNPGSGSSTDKAFFPAFGGKFSGLERKGYGAIAGASLYDIIKTSSTANGLPYGVSGLNIINLGFDLPYKKLIISADIYKFRASKNANNGSLQIASEWDIKASYPMGENMQVNAVYAVFTPLGLYPQSKQAKLTYAAISARF
ncbi:MAG: alginate export family protein [Elusimicrobiota bacterium]|nr:alginate export family protein [Elusimicrobiota bacterium]